jgi:hypothetical protein
VWEEATNKDNHSPGFELQQCVSGGQKYRGVIHQSLVEPETGCSTSMMMMMMMMLMMMMMY